MSTSFWNVILRHWVIDVQYCDKHGGHIFKGQKGVSSWTFSTLEYGTITLSQNTTHQLPSDVAHIPEERGPRPLSSLSES